jgi:ABC-type transport system involved in Fe-S cluster assembly fused permease/ATPase subunit
MPNYKDYLFLKVLPWGQTLVTSVVTGALMALGAVKINHGEVFNFSSEWNTTITLKLAAWGAFLGFLQHIMKSPIPIPEVEAKKECNKLDKEEKAEKILKRQQNEQG